MELEQEYNKAKGTPLPLQGRVQRQELHKDIGLVSLLGKAWQLFNAAAMRVFLMIGIVILLQIMHNAHGQMLITIPMILVGASVLIGELVNLYNEIDMIWTGMN